MTSNLNKKCWTWDNVEFLHFNIRQARFIGNYTLEEAFNNYIDVRPTDFDQYVRFIQIENGKIIKSLNYIEVDRILKLNEL
jgi:hypothetical protein